MLTQPCFRYLALFAGLVVVACTESTTPGLRTSETQTGSAKSNLVERNFVPESDNPYFPLVPGTTFHYESKTADGTETEDFIVTSDTKVIQGVTVRVVQDIVWLDGALIELTFDWFAQDEESGDVWYFGENSTQFDPETGKVIGREGSWQAGRNGAEAGIIMLGDPKVGDSYNEENAPGVAEDMAEVLSLDAHASVPFGNFHGCLKTANFTPLEPDLQEEKYYCPGIGLVLEVNVSEGEKKEPNKLISKTQ